MPELSNDLIKDAVKEAAKEWLADQFERVGRWTMAGVASAALVGLLYLALTAAGWRR